MAKPETLIAARHLLRTIFVSLPARQPLVEYVEGTLSEAIQSSFGRMRAVSFRVIRQGSWLPQIEDGIAYSNAVVAFLENGNPNVLLEVGEAYALGKPLILVVECDQQLPAMIRHLQAITTDRGERDPDLAQHIVAALDEAVFSPLHREQSDVRTKLQQRLLTGAALSQAQNVKRVRSRHMHGASDKSLRDARRLQRAGNFRAAISCLHEALDAGLRDEAAFHLLADTWFLDGESAVDREDADASYEQMLVAAESGLTFHPASFLLRKDRSLALLKRGQIDDAERGFRALLGEPENGVIHYNLACLAAQRRDLLTTLSELRTAMHKVPYYRGLARVDPDFDPLWTEPLFQALIFGKT